MNHLSSETFRENARAALADVQLRGALKNATSLFGERRKTAAASVPDWEELRNQARAIKDEVLAHLDKYLEEFVQAAESRGEGGAGGCAASWRVEECHLAVW